jgi:hypothetical protein
LAEAEDASDETVITVKDQIIALAVNIWRRVARAASMATIYGNNEITCGNSYSTLFNLLKGTAFMTMG